MLSSPVHRSKSPAEVSQTIKHALQWFKQRPLVAVVSFLLFLLLASVFVPFLILDYFSASFGGGASSPYGPGQMGGGGGAGAGLISSRGIHSAQLKDLRTALGIDLTRTAALDKLAEHGKEYAATHGKQGAIVEGGATLQSAAAVDTVNSPAAATTVAPAIPPSPPASPSVPAGHPDRAAAVVSAFRHAYGAYERKCMGQDEYHPMSQRCSNWIASGLTIIDALPTMMLMGLTPEVERARDWITRSMRFDQNGAISFFETTIRVLGGLISAHDLSGGQGADRVYLEKARQLADKLLPAFQTPSGLPHSQINLATGQTGDFGWTGGAVLLAEVGTCQMEFFAMTQRTGDDKYRAAAQKPIDVLDHLRVKDGLYPIYLSWQTGQPTNNRITLGAMGDSWYEYLMKVWLLTGRKNEQLKRMYRESIHGVLTHLYTSSGADHGDYWFLADMQNGVLERKMDHLVCFVPGMLALGVEEGIVEGAVAMQHMDAAKKLMRTCYATYELQQPTHIGPEYVTFRPDMQPGEPSYKLRPEMVESLFIMWRVTRDEQYRDQAWATFQAIERHCRHPDGGYTALMDVRNPAAKEDKMESFFLAETLKYLYLIQAPDAEERLPLTGKRKPGQYFVLNTEAHPIRSWE